MSLFFAIFLLLNFKYKLYYINNINDMSYFQFKMAEFYKKKKL